MILERLPYNTGDDAEMISLFEFKLFNNSLLARDA